MTPIPAPPEEIVFLLDCDNTLLDNDAVQREFGDHLTAQCGPECRDRFWTIYERLRGERGYADYLGALQRCREDTVNDTRLLELASFLLDYPYASRLLPGALDAIRHLARWGSVVILSDGDAVLQPRKIQRSGLWAAVEGRVLVYIHKERMLDAIAERYPARHYVMVDDKLRILAAMKGVWGGRLTTILSRQGHYALDPEAALAYPAADLTIEGIGDLIAFERSTLLNR